MVRSVALGVALALAGCATEPTGAPPAADTFPVGTYTRCAGGVHTPTGNVFPNVAGFQAGAVLTLVQRESEVQATYVDQNGAIQSLAFVTTSGTAASLAQPGAVLPGFTSLCIEGLEGNRAYPATLTTAGGVMTYSRGMIFIALTGALRSEAGACGTLSDPAADAWIVCEDRAGVEPPPVEPAPVPDTQLPVGAYACAAQVEAHDRIDGLGYYASGGGAGTLTLEVDRGEVTVAYRDAASLDGTLRLSATTATTAAAAPGQRLAAPCLIPAGSGGVPGALPIAAASLALVDATLFVSMAGTMDAGSSCPGTEVAASLICARPGQLARQLVGGGEQVAAQ